MPANCAMLPECIAVTATPAPDWPDSSLPLVCIQGIGFVGTAMAIAVAIARGDDGRPAFNVVAVDLDSATGRARADALASGTLGFKNSDLKLEQAHRTALATGNLKASVNSAMYGQADVVIVNINLDVDFSESPPSCNLGSFRQAITTLGDRVRSGALIIVETTVPPGTCERVIAPILAERLALRGLPPSAVLLAHSYERVMPGVEYLDSIINFWRVYSGHTMEAADACEKFLIRIIDTKRFPLTRVATTNASEMGKVMENSYRAVTIAFVEEWSRMAERVGVDLFPVIDAIRVRPTHSNFRQPGFGVGGYCLTKDPLFGGIAGREIFHLAGLAFPMSELAVAINQRMPLETLRLVREGLGGSLQGRKILLLGISYRSDVGDTRHAPAEHFVRQAVYEGAEVQCYDPLLARWEELKQELPARLPAAAGYDVVVFTSGHEEFARLELASWLGGARLLIVDSNRVFSTTQLSVIKSLGLPFRSIGRGTTS